MRSLLRGGGGEGGLSPLTGLVVALGIISFGLGVLAVFVTSKDTGAATLIAAGVGLLLVAVFGDRVSTVEAAGVKLGLLALQRAEKAERDGRPEEAEQLRSSGVQLLAAASDVSRDINTLRTAMPSSWRRTAELERLMAQVRGSEMPTQASREQVIQLFARSTEGDRATALALMQARPQLFDLASVRDALLSSRSGFEQYQALRAAQEAVRTQAMHPAERSALVGVVQEALDIDAFQGGGDRIALARAVVDEGSR